MHPTAPETSSQKSYDHDDPAQRAADLEVRVPRRSFLQALGLGVGGLALGGFARAAAARAPVSDDGFRPNVFVHIATNGLVSIVCARSEMGQGVRSTLPALIAGEIGADLARIRVVQGDGDAAYGDQNTDGSTSVRRAFRQLRRTGATARVMLAQAAAARWRVPVAEIEVRDHRVQHRRSGRSADLGAFAAAAARLPVPPPKQAPLRDDADLTVLGAELPFIDAPDIVTGKAVYGADVRLPGMLTAVIARPPVAGGRVASVDAAAARAVADVVDVITLPAPTLPFRFQPLGGVAVVARHTWAAMRGRARLQITWDDGDDDVVRANAAHTTADYAETLRETVERPGKVVRQLGDVDAALAGAARRHVAVYEAPYLPHATMEPPVAVARVDGDRCEAWASTQNPQAAQSEVAKALGIPPENVTIHVTLLGGGFGRKSKPDYVVEAALLAKKMGAPVRVQWTREDDLRHDYYHSVSCQRLEAGLSEDNRVVAWQHRTAFPPIGSLFSGTATPNAGALGLGFLDVPLAVPNVRGEACDAVAHTRIGWLRSVANIYHAFAAHSFIDELAHLRGVDPLEQHLAMLGATAHKEAPSANEVKSPKMLGVDDYPNYGQSLDEYPIDVARHRHVLERAATLARWGQRQAEGRALGLAVHRSFLTYVAVVISVKKTSSGRIAVDEAWIVADAGIIINAERVRSQLEGAVLFGLSQALYGEVTMRGGATVEGNFRDHRLLRLPEAPRAVHVEVVKSTAPPAGVGEPGVPPVAPALTNALFALTGTRVRRLPVVQTLPV